MTVHSNDGASWLTKLERIGKKSANDKQQVFNKLGHLLNSDMLKGQFLRLDGNKAVGIDRMTKAAYGEHLDDNINNLIMRIRRGTYHPKAARIMEIPKEDGSKRPLAISCIEDKLGQVAVSDILSRIYEPLFMPCSYGFRPGLLYRWFNRKGGRRRLTWKKLNLILKMLGYPFRWKTHSMFISC